MKIVNLALMLAILVVSGAGAYRTHQRLQRLETPLDAQMNPGMVCDKVAVEMHEKTTVGWYHGCIDYAAEVLQKHAGQ